jgi:hypothetical protein
MRAYKFLSGKYGLKSLSERRLRRTRINELNDPFELRPYDLTDPDLRWAFLDTRKRLAQEFGLLCFSADWCDPVIWAHFENPVGPKVDGYGRAIAPADGSVLIDDKKSALGDSFSVAESSVKLRHRAFGFEVCEQRKVQLAIARKRGVAPNTVHGNCSSRLDRKPG